MTGWKSFTQAERKCAAVAVGLVVLLVGAFWLFGIRINTSYSVPMGLYVETRNVSAGLIEFCPEGHSAIESRERHYRGRGVCPDGGVPLLKPVIAQPGDIVEMSDRGIVVNGRDLAQTAPLSRDCFGRPLQAWPTGRYGVAAGTVWVASTYNRGSYDSRYMGPIRTRLIRSRLKPVWTFSR